MTSYEGIAESQCSGKSNSVTITNEKGRLSPDEIERMVKEAEDFAAEDEAQRKRIEALNGLSSFVFGLKTQLGEQDAFGGKLSENDREELLTIIKETTTWIDDFGQAASAEDLEEKLQGMSFSYDRAGRIIANALFVEVQKAVSPITSKIYAGGDYAAGADSEQDPLRSHDEL